MVPIILSHNLKALEGGVLGSCQYIKMHTQMYMLSEREII